MLYYEYHDQQGTDKEFEVDDTNGNLLYQSYSLNNGKIQASGYLLHAMSHLQSIIPITGGKYLVNGTTFINEPGKTNLYPSGYPYSNTNGKAVILGNLSFNPVFNRVNALRAPFNSVYELKIKNLADKTYNYYMHIAS